MSGATELPRENERLQKELAAVQSELAQSQIQFAHTNDKLQAI